MHRRKDGTGHLLNGILTVAEDDIPSVMIYEFTHSLWISDLYVYAEDGYSTGSEVGVWSNMDYGPLPRAASTHRWLVKVPARLD